MKNKFKNVEAGEEYSYSLIACENTQNGLDAAQTAMPEFAPYDPKARRKENRKFNRKENTVAFLFILIPLIGFCMFTIISMVASVLYSFTDLNPIKHGEPILKIFKDIVIQKSERKPHGIWQNYFDLFTNPLLKDRFLRAITNTLVLMLSVPTSMILGLILAVLLSTKGIKGTKLMRMLYYLPAVSSAVAMNFLWRYVFNSETGIAAMISFTKNIQWLSDNTAIKAAIIIKNSWGGMGGNMLLYLAGILSISRDYYEAADIDGASAVRQFFAITLPMLSPVTFYMLIMGVIGGLQSFVDADVFANGDDGAQTIVYFIWQRMGENRYGSASAASILLASVIMVVTSIQFRLSNSWVYEE